jgi:hypothetical protein
LNSCPAA